MPPAPPPPVIVGRDSELSAIRSLVTATRDGEGSSALIVGDAGIGKTTMIESAVALARSEGFRVLRCRGVRSGQDVGFTGLHELIRPIADDIRHLPDRQRRAIEGAFGLREPARGDALILNIGVLSLIEDLAETTPVLLVVEDLHWMDASTAEVLAFLASRMTERRTLLVAASREGATYTDWSRSFEARIALAPLSDADALALIDGRWPQFDVQTRRAILASAKGNPLALSEFGAEKANRVAPRESVPIPRSERLDQSFLWEVSMLPAASRSALLVVAAGEDASVHELVVALQRLDLSIGDLTAAEHSRLIRLERDAYVFRHPLIAAALYDRADTESRARVHGALAAAVGDERRAAWHRASSVIGLDAGAAQDLEQAAELADARGALSEAAAAWRRSADLSPVDDDRARRLARAGELSRQAGDLPAAIAATEEARGYARDPQVLHDIVATQWMVSVTSGHQGLTPLELIELAQRSGDSSHDAEYLLFAATTSYISTADLDVRRAVADALRRLPPEQGAGYQLIGLSLVDRDYRPTVEEILQHFVGEISAIDAMVLNVAGFAAENAGDPESAERMFGASQQALHRAGRIADETAGLSGRCGQLITLGRLNEGLADAEQCLRLGEDAGLLLVGAVAAAEAGRARARRGENDLALEALETSRRLSGDAPIPRIRAMQSWAEAIVAMNQNRHADAAELLDGMRGYPIIAHWTGLDTVDCAMRTKNFGLVGRWLDETRAFAEETQSLRLMVQVTAVEAVLRDSPDAADLFEKAIEIGKASGAEVDTAHARLIFGEWLRRSRRIVEARTQLREAAQVLRANSFLPLAERAAAELRAAGESTTARETSENIDPVAVLTAQELLVARLAARGMTNKEIADNVYLSHRTVGAHLHRAFAKLGVSRRAQLAVLID